ncbi:HEAT repeat domain-containing protein [Nocardia stercoris]|uniref:HEAT repeat domain-containing protein n=2 Tax=Nocardia stercoris TaxID=2483361 RepID=A0A3M2LAI7_9NOCA|nr:HEAT repeat domain-containing protein [Nocardia stercoris]
MTHGQLVAKVLNDPAIRAAVESRPAAAEAKRRYDESAVGILADLTVLGFHVESVQDLYQRRMDYRSAVPVLLDWLPRVDYMPLFESIVSALAFVGPAKKQRQQIFLQYFRNPTWPGDPQTPPGQRTISERIRFAVAEGLHRTAGPAIADDLIDLALNRSYGETRAAIILGLPKTRDDRVPTILITVLNDPTVRTYAVKVLGQMRYEPARQVITAMADLPDRNLRAHIRTALKRIDRT